MHKALIIPKCKSKGKTTERQTAFLTDWQVWDAALGFRFKAGFLTIFFNTLY